MKLNRVVLIALSLILGIGAMTGCVNKAKLNETLNHVPATVNVIAEQEQVIDQSEVNTILRGSINALPFMLELTQGLPYDITAVGKEAAIEAVNFTEAQLALFDGTLDEAVGLSEIVAYAGVVLIVNPKSGLENITVEEVRGFFTGETQDIQGQNLTLVLPSKALPSRMLFEELFPLKGDINGIQKSLITDAAVTVDTDEAVIQEVANNPNAIGVINVGQINTQVKGLKLEGIEANQSTIVDGTYTATKPIVLMAQASNKEVFHIFIELTKSEKGKTAIKKIGFVPVN